jgi:hypothetical protein
VLAVALIGGTMSSAPVVASGTPHRAAQGHPVAAYARLSPYFEANQGQTDPSVKFLLRGRGHGVFLTSTEAVLVLQKPCAARDPTASGHGPENVRKDACGSPASIVRMRLVGGNAAPRVSGREELPGKANYYRGNDPAKWRRNVPLYRRVEYRDVYPGVSLTYYESQGQLEYDFVVSPGADPKVIRLEFEGAKRLRLGPDGSLVVETVDGELIQRAPVVYQEVDGARKPIRAKHVLKRRKRVGFKVGRYDRRQPLVIDPVLVYSTYLGGSGADAGVGIAVDAFGNAYVTGRTSSMDFPTAGTPSQTVYAGGFLDAFVTKLSPTSSLVYSTYLGGSGDDQGNGIAVDGSGNAYVTGDTFSADFPTAGTPSQPNLAGPHDGFVTKLDPTSALVYSTFLGGSAAEQGLGIAVDGSGNAYVAGYSSSIDFPTAGTPSQGVYAGNTDAFVTKLSSTSTLLYSTYLGGSVFDRAFGIEVDASGNAYVTGDTDSTDFPTAGAPSQAANGGSRDAFVTKLGPASARVYSTYLGGSTNEVGSGIAVDGSANAYVTGWTSSTDFPTAGTPSQPTNAGDFDAFLTKLNPTSARVYSTYLGGVSSENGYGIAVDAFGNAYIIGFATSVDFPTAGMPPQPVYAGNGDSFVTAMRRTSALLYSTYLGGTGSDVGLGVAADALGNVYLAGSAGSTDFPTAGTPSQGTYAGAGDAFVARISAPSLEFHTVVPCRLLDTRNAPGPIGGPALIAGTSRAFAVAGNCGLPPTAAALSLNIAVTQPTSAGNLRLHPAGTPVPQVSSINYAAGQTRSNNAIVPLGPDGDLSAFCAQGSGTVHFILDVNGYFH